MSTDVERAPVQRPMFTQLLPPTKEVPEGTRVRLDCVLVGRPEPEVSDKNNSRCVHALCVSPYIARVCIFKSNCKIHSGELCTSSLMFQ